MKSFSGKFRKQLPLQVMALSGIGWMMIFCYIPILWLGISFLDFNITKPVYEAPFVGLKYFKEFLSDPRFFRAVKNTFGISFFKLLIGFPLPIVFALFLNEIRNNSYKRLVQTVTYLPHFISWVIFGGLVLNWLTEEGIVNQVLIAIGLQDDTILYISKPEYFWAIAVVSEVFKELGWNAIIYIAALTTISPELYWAADIDGAGRFQKMWHVSLQCIKPTIAILFILAVSNILASNFDQTFVLKNSMNLSASETIDLYVYNIGLSQGRFSYSTAVSLSRSLVALALLLVANGVSRQLTDESLF